MGPVPSIVRPKSAVALPTSPQSSSAVTPSSPFRVRPTWASGWKLTRLKASRLDRKSTRLNSSHSQISYAVFCLKKKKKTKKYNKISECKNIHNFSPTTYKPSLYYHHSIVILMIRILFHSVTSQIDLIATRSEAS